MTPERFAGKKEMPRLGGDPVTVPGAVSAWAAVSKQFGKLPFEKLVEPAANYAEKGFLVSPHTAEGWEVAVKKYADFPDFGKTFLPGGRSPRAGEKFANPDQARTLRRIGETKGEAFYRGDVAEKIAAAAKAGGGLMTAADLASHAADWVEPIS